MLTPDLDKIPPELKARPQCVCWSLEEREGKPTKVPKNPKTGGNAQADKPATWGTYPQALKQYESHRNKGIAGIGYMFSADDPYTGVDIDHCRDRETGQLKYCAQVLNEYLDSYSEVSPSGTGIHIITKAKWPKNAGNSKTLPCGMKIEVFDRRRYFTVTGHHLEGTPTTIEARQAQLTTLHTEIFGKHQAPPKATGPVLELSDRDLIEKAQTARNGEKFYRLMNGGISEYGGDESRADLALCSILAFWTQDPAQIDRIFRTSNLYRDKWDRPTAGSTYGAMTIEKAIAGKPRLPKPKESTPTANRSQNPKSRLQ